jgi:hypothetical protein
MDKRSRSVKEAKLLIPEISAPSMDVGSWTQSASIFWEGDRSEHNLSEGVTEMLFASEVMVVSITGSNKLQLLSQEKRGGDKFLFWQNAFRRIRLLSIMGLFDFGHCLMFGEHKNSGTQHTSVREPNVLNPRPTVGFQLSIPDESDMPPRF